jgi:hypothetical protein
MPGFLGFIVSAGTITPIAILISLLFRKNLDQVDFNGLAISFLSLCVVLIWISSYLFLKRERTSRIVWLVSWVLLSLSSLVPVVDGQPSNDIGVQVVTNLILGLLIGVYLFKSKAVNRYFEKVPLDAEWMSFGPLSLLGAHSAILWGF